MSLRSRSLSGEPWAQRSSRPNDSEECFSLATARVAMVYCGKRTWKEKPMQTEARSVREKILAAAIQFFAEFGYHASTMRDIARVAGIQAASIYYHYANKQALLVEIMDT